MDLFRILGFFIIFLGILRDIYYYGIIVRIIFSWFSMGGRESSNALYGFLVDFTNPVLNLAKKLPHRVGMLDLSPIIALIGIDLLYRLIIYLVTGIV